MLTPSDDQQWQFRRYQIIMKNINGSFISLNNIVMIKYYLKLIFLDYSNDTLPTNWTSPG